MNKKTIAVMGLALMALPLFAQAMGAAASGAATGASLGTAFAPGVGTIIGAIVGGIGGLAAGVIQEQQQLNSDISELESTNTQLKSNMGDQELALSNWQTEYDSSMLKATNTAQDNLDIMKSNWGLVNNTNAAMGQGGGTAKLLSEKAKQKVIDYAGEDMTLDDSKSFYEGIYADAKNFDADGNLTSAALDKISSAMNSKKYGIYEKQIGTEALAALQNKNNAKKTLEADKKALEKNNKSIKKLQAQKTGLFLF